ncbi:hypothetical protein [uncultured Secundilactobacillus sp.]|uniref:hypothetical protein n=1 Tax=uncultured Secundilactobacillus sp. TaxID=2813935 RepID=UPI00258E025B|nr:hypothetical protein [uncultured Secundilactobacillus sp.]
MIIFGLPISDWASLVAVLGSALTVAFYLFRAIVVNPINQRNAALQASISSLTMELKRMREDTAQTHEDFKTKLHEHDVELAKHDVEINELKGLQQ